MILDGYAHETVTTQVDNVLHPYFDSKKRLISLNNNEVSGLYRRTQPK
ncbi:hypothetical protein DFP95_111128 [Cohnella lupini]|uniref:Uncharacterized protein n=1 Tax=Cohnella lupini TaxID=1294267 RepID=A0A3D9I615_9BACL|nr:hypothetical protein DFP95_111128 [Cohnella lupini]